MRLFYEISLGRNTRLPAFLQYVTVMGAIFAALLGFHLLTENHSLSPFSVPLLIFNLAQLYLIVFHYVLMSSVDYTKLIYDILFFVGMTGISVFMMAHIGILSGVRNTIDRLFEKDPSEQKPVGKQKEPSSEGSLASSIKAA